MNAKHEQQELRIRLTLGSVQTYSTYPLREVSIRAANDQEILTLHPECVGGVNRNFWCLELAPTSERVGQMRINVRYFWISDFSHDDDNTVVVTMSAATANAVCDYLAGYGNHWCAVSGMPWVVEAWMHRLHTAHMLATAAKHGHTETATT